VTASLLDQRQRFKLDLRVQHVKKTESTLSSCTFLERLEKRDNDAVASALASVDRNFTCLVVVSAGTNRHGRYGNERSVPSSVGEMLTVCAPIWLKLNTPPIRLIEASHDIIYQIRTRLLCLLLLVVWLPTRP
jgi:hypothetical protein